jgi:hypothetical protein
MTELPEAAVAATAGLVALFIFVLLAAKGNKDSRLPLPPGPRGLPIFGNMYQVAAEYPWKQQVAWTEKYGPVFSLKLGQRTVIVLGTFKSASDLLDKRSRIYSNRPEFIVAAKYISGGGSYAPLQRFWVTSAG